MKATPREAPSAVRAQRELSFEFVLTHLASRRRHQLATY
jgi:hypothetical protein